MLEELLIVIMSVIIYGTIMVAGIYVLFLIDHLWEWNKSRKEDDRRK
jgi:hypothetical protein|tara:strand:+ start:1107 stop:1247 length:141 start_codon:yes stop_codon:yes gene_type:complete